MIDRIVGGKALPVEVLTQIVAKTDGVPLFVEELTKTVLESGLLRKANGAYVLAAPLTPLAIPSTLQDSLMAQLDRLAPVKETAQIGAAIGREFSYRLLEAVSPIQGPALRDALGQLMVAELIHGRGAPPEAIYIFKHALVQDTAYASLLRSRRQRIHADIAQALEERFADQVDTAPALIAHHFTEAGLAEPAARYWLAAAELALSRSAPTEAGRYIDGGLSLLPRLTDGSERQVLELSLQLARANMLIQVNGFAEPETVAALTMAKNILDAGVGTDLQRFSVLYGLCFATFIAARMEPALAFAREIVGVADRQDDTIYKLVGHRLVGMIQVFMGQSRVGLENLQLCEPYYDPVRQKRLSYRFGTDPGLAVLCYKTRALQFLGLHDQATRVTEKVLAELPSHGHAFTVAMCNGSVMVWSELVFGDLVACEGHSLELIRYCTEKKVELWRSLGILYHACAHAKREPTKENIAALRAAIDIRHSSTANSICISYLAETLLTAGDVTGAEATLQEAFAFVEQSGERFWLADLHRVEGQIALKRSGPDPARAEACFLQAIEIARSQEARMLELRGATDLARLWRDTGSPDDPRALLEPILATIEGGESTRDVRNARALLREVT